MRGGRCGSRGRGERADHRAQYHPGDEDRRQRRRSADPRPSADEQPFARYNVFRLLDRKQFRLAGPKPVSYALVNGRTIQVALEGMSDAGERRYQLEAQISELGKADFLKGLHVTASENQAFFVGGQSYQGGTLFLELVVRP